MLIIIKLLIVDASKSQRIQIENIMKKVLAANFMPEDLSGERALEPQRERKYFPTLLRTISQSGESLHSSVGETFPARNLYSDWRQSSRGWWSL